MLLYVIVLLINYIVFTIIHHHINCLQIGFFTIQFILKPSGCYSDALGSEQSISITSLKHSTSFPPPAGLASVIPSALREMQKSGVQMVVTHWQDIGLRCNAPALERGLICVCGDAVLALPSQLGASLFDSV